MDSIVKNVKEPYIGLFSRNLAQASFKTQQDASSHIVSNIVT